MVTWKPIRAPNFLPPGKRREREVRGDTVPFSTEGNIPEIREVKKNLFPATLLKPKDLSLRRNHIPLHNGVQLQLDCILHNATVFFVRLFANHYQQGSFRRSRSQRKKDWSLAIAWLLRSLQKAAKEGFRRPHRSYEPPLLRSILCSSVCNISCNCLGLPTMAVLPPKASSVLSVESNMCFEIESLRSVSNSRCETGHMDNATGSRTFFKEILDTLQSESPPETRISSTLLSELPFPVLTSTRMRKSRVQTKGSERGQGADTSLAREEIFGSRFPFIQQKHIVSKGGTRLPRDILDSFRKTSVHSLLQNSCRMNTGKKNVLSSIRDGSSHKLLSSGFSEDLFPLRAKNWIPIFPALLFTKPSNLQVINQSSLRPIKSSYVWAKALSRFQRNVFTCQVGIWSRATRDILSRGPHARKKLLFSSSHFSSLSTFSSLNITSKDTADNALALGEDGRLRLQLISTLKSLSDRRCSESCNMLFVSNGMPLNNLVVRRREAMETRHHHAVRGAINQYDPPARKWGCVHYRAIPSRYDSTATLPAEKGEVDARHDNIPTHEREVDSDESLLDDMVLSADEENGNAGLEDVVRTLAHMEGYDHGTDKLKYSNGAEVNGAIRGNAHCDGIRERSKVSLKVPTDLVCAPWVLRAAEQCLEAMPRGSIFMPYPLSVLPLVSVMMNTLLRDSTPDQRVLIVCETHADLAGFLFEYIRSSLGESISVEHIDLSRHGRKEDVVTLPSTTARVVILDSFGYEVIDSFAFLVVLVDNEAAMSYGKNNKTQMLRKEIGVKWSQIPLVLLAPIDPWVRLEGYVSAVLHISPMLELSGVLLVTAREDVDNYILLSTPRFLDLVPSPQVLRLVKELDVTCQRYISSYRQLQTDKNRHKPTDITHLRQVNLKHLKEFLQGRMTEACDKFIMDLEVLYHLRQARFYAVHDGLETALAYLRTCMQQGKAAVVSTLKRVVQFVPEKEEKPGIGLRCHPVVRILRRCLYTAEKTMSSDAPSLRGIHRRDSFTPLIIANSSEAVAGLHKGIENAQRLHSAMKSSTALCTLQELKAAANEKSSSWLRQKLEQVSHVFHIVDDRDDIRSELVLPGSLLQQIHAGRTRLTSIVVDEERELADLWHRDSELYNSLMLALCAEKNRDDASRASYLLQTSTCVLKKIAKDILHGCAQGAGKGSSISTVKSDAHRAFQNDGRYPATHNS